MKFKKRTFFAQLLILMLSIVVHADATNSTPVFNEGFEYGISDWKVSSNQSIQKVNLSAVNNPLYNGMKALSVPGVTNGDVVLEYAKGISITPGKIYELSAWIKVDSGNTQIAYHKYSKDNQFKWGVGRKTIVASKGWTKVTNFIMADKGDNSIQPIFIFAGKGPFLIDEVVLKEIGLFDASQLFDEKLSCSNDFLTLEFDTNLQLLTVNDKRNQKTWSQGIFSNDLVLIDAKLVDNHFVLDYYFGQNNLYFTATFFLEKNKPEFRIDIDGNGDLGDNTLVFPQPFVTEKGTRVIFPANEGLSYPVEDTTVNEFWVESIYGRLSMAFAGATDGQAGYMFIVHTPYDAGIGITRVNNLLCALPIWNGEKQKFGYKRSLSYIFFDQGGLVSIAKRYREEAVKNGHVKTLIDKKKTNPNIDKLVGSPYILTGLHLNWPTKDLVSKMKQIGFSRMVWDNGDNFEIIKLLDSKTQLISYDEALVSTVNPKYKVSYLDFLKGAWPSKLRVNKAGDYVPSWGSIYAGYGEDYDREICDTFFTNYGKLKTESDLKKFPYTSRFSDALGCQPFSECYDPLHPMTRTQSKDMRVNYFKYLSQTKKLVTGTENGSDAFVPFVDYLDGMMTVGPGFDLRLDKLAGHTDPKENVIKYQVGYKYRIPLWELVYHDCIVSYWHRSDNSNSFPSIWDNRDLFNVLYGTPPTYFFDMDFWNKNVSKFKKSYNMTIPVARAVGYAEMTDFQYLTESMDVQATKFSNGVSVIVNFGSIPFTNTDGTIINGLNYKVYGMK